MKHAVIFTTCSSEKEGRKIADKLIKAKLAACVNILPGIRSIYRWESKIESSSEILLIIKTKKQLIRQLVRAAKKLHSYKVPEIIALPIVEGNKDYLKWIEDSVK